MRRILPVLLALLVGNLTSVAAAPKAEPVAWEYLVLTSPQVVAKGDPQAADRRLSGLNALGADGWELAAIDPNPDLGTGPLQPGNRPPLYIFKRRK